jgi:hypothetical protein
LVAFLVNLSAPWVAKNCLVFPLPPTLKNGIFGASKIASNTLYLGGYFAKTSILATFLAKYSNLLFF